MKISCSLLAYVNLDIESGLRQVKALGFKWVDLAFFQGWTAVGPSQVAEAGAWSEPIKAWLADLGLMAVAVHASFGANLCALSEEEKAKVTRETEALAGLAAQCGAPLVNVQPGHQTEDQSLDEALEGAIGAMTELLEVCRRQGAALSFEAHTGSIGERPEQCLRILEAVPGLRLDYDPSHFVAQEIPFSETEDLLRYVAHVGIRNARPGDFNVPMEGDQVDYDLGWLIEQLKRREYEGALSVEYFQPGMEDSVVSLKRLLEGLTH